MIVPLDSLTPDDPVMGGKASGLAKIRAAGLPVPEGFVIPATATQVPVEAAAAAVALGGPLVVRSSATVEDAEGGAAPGLFVSRRDVDPAQLDEAVRAVWSSLRSPAVAAYLARRGGTTTPAMAVIVQRQVDGVLGTAYSRAPGDDTAVLVERADGRTALVDRETRVVRGDLDGAAEIAEAAIAAERALGRPADIEWARGDRLWILQARPIRPGPRPATSPEIEAACDFARAEPDAVWTWDAVHNPDPLSPAQAGLVELVDAARAATVRQRLVLGYLYTTPHGAPGPARDIPPEDLAEIYRLDIAPALERALAAMRPDDLEATLSAYLDFYHIYARVLAPAVARAGRVAVPAPQVSTGDLSPAWDVAVPTFGESSVALATVRPTTINEADDFLFARAQAGVRRALLDRARRWQLPDPEVFFLPLEAVRAGKPIDAHLRAAAALAERARQRQIRPPIRIVGGRAVFPPPAGPVLRGRGAGGIAQGPVVRLDAESARPVPPGSIVVSRTFIPPMAPLLMGAAAFVAEHGGLLGHGAALARELGVPCVVGCVGAGNLAEGEVVWVNGDAGLVGVV